jgi:hypothetical protein
MDFDLNLTLETLARTPAAVDALLRGSDPAWHSSNEGPDTWSALDVIGHFLHGEETDWVPRARIILEHGEARPFEPFDRFAQFQRFGDWDIDALLDRFAELRRENLAVVRGWNLTDAQLSLRGLHPALGVVDLRQLLATWVVHDFNHIAQISRVMAKAYEGEVGPWSEYLSVLQR